MQKLPWLHPGIFLVGLLLAANGCNDHVKTAATPKIVDCRPVVECPCAAGGVGKIQCDLQGNPLGCACPEQDAGVGSPPDAAGPNDLAVEKPVVDQGRIVSDLGGDPPPVPDSANPPPADLAPDSPIDTASLSGADPRGGDGGAILPIDGAVDSPRPGPDTATPDLRKYDVAIPDGATTDLNTCVPDPAEWCDGRDNDCDGVIDNGHVCPEPGVANTLPFTDGVYLQGTTTEGLCGTDALQRFWPTKEKAYYFGFDCYADLFRFRPGDGQLFYQATFSGIHLDDSAGTQDTLVPTPPCGDMVLGQFGFDGAGTLHYVCNGSIRRGNGQSITGATSLAAVLADGRMVVTRYSPAGIPRFELVDTAGNTVSMLDLAKEYVGTPQALPGACTVKGNDAFLLLSRKLGQDPLEMVVYRLTAGNQWLLVRRVTTKRAGMSNLVISDGTVFVREDDPTSTFGERIVAFPPAGNETIVWREDEAPVVRAHIGDQLLVGPATAQGPSVKAE